MIVQISDKRNIVSNAWWQQPTNPDGKSVMKKRQCHSKERQSQLTDWKTRRADEVSDSRQLINQRTDFTHQSEKQELKAARRNLISNEVLIEKKKKSSARSVEIWSQKQHLTERTVKNLSTLTKRKQFVSQLKMFEQRYKWKVKPNRKRGGYRTMTSCYSNMGLTNGQRTLISNWWSSNLD